MTYTVPTDVPAALTAGLTWRFTKALAAFPPSEGWTVSLRIIGSTAITIAGAQSDSAWEFVGAAPATARMAPGRCRYIITASLAGDLYEAARGDVTVLPDPAAAPCDHVSTAEAQLVKVRAALSGLLDGRVQSWAIGTRQFTAFDLAELRAMEKDLVIQVSTSRRFGMGRQIKYALGRPV
jgi:hypothetical protein